MSIESNNRPQEVLTVLKPLTRLVIGKHDRLCGWYYFNIDMKLYTSYRFLYNEGVFLGRFPNERSAIDEIMKIGERCDGSH